ncbi:MAG: asparagine synthase (glutamine-hydrolyzing) [Proteobacteria bacterium]|jgi:asparagine synthase (glutamine-hydrolysing)|nr:asparagine synthase (glutamine-hydrolyzing) [Pseudomonadota bacterium]
MCGISAIHNYLEGKGPIDKELLGELDRLQAFRGPDGNGQYFSQQGDLGLAHRRLAIIDVTETGAQPMISPDGRYVISFNGEIYNYKELAAELKEAGFDRAYTSDTSVILSMYEHWGERMLDKLVGMYAFIIWDEHAQSLFAARDVYGIKPLYYMDDGERVVFASRLKALATGLRLSDEWPQDSKDAFLMLGSVYEPGTVIRDIFLLPAGHLMRVDGSGVMLEQYASIGKQLLRTDRKSTDHLPTIVKNAVIESVKRHLVSDVPVGLLLSSGIDSAAVASVMAERSNACVTAITIVYGEGSDGTDESVLARKLADRLGFQHVVRNVSKQEFLADLPLILKMMDQPSIDGINIWFAAKAVKEQGLKVVLSGVGGDELFGGYPSFRNLRRLTRLALLFRYLPLLPGLIGYSARIVGVRLSSKLQLVRRYAIDPVGGWLVQRGLWSATLPKEQIESFYHSARVRIDSKGSDLNSESNLAIVAGVLEAECYMRNQLLRDADWAAMAHSVELRVPLVDSALLSSLAPYVNKLLEQPGKHLLAQLINPSLREMFERRPKSGFTMPIGGWLSEKLDHSTRNEHWSYSYSRWIAKNWNAAG